MKKNPCPNLCGLKTIFLLFVFLIGIGIQIVNAQDREITGTVTDEDGNTLPGVNIIIEGTTTGTITDMDGNYSIEAPADATLVFSFVGYQQETIQVEGREELNVELEQSITMLGEVVAIGYGEVRREELTSSVSSVSTDELNIDPAASTDVIRVLQGKISGLTITRTRGGDPSQRFEIRLRGTSSVSAGQEPLIVIDGIPGGNLNALIPEDIKSIDVLKDASAAAMYGTRGTNGVILVKTKSGEKAKQQDVNVSYSVKIFTETVLRQTQMLSREQYLQLKEDLQDIHPEKADAMIDYGYDTNWFDEIMRDLPFNQNHTLAISGGGENSSYRLSGSYMNHKGKFITTSRENYKVSLNLNQRALNDMLIFNAQLGTNEVLSTPSVDYAYRQGMTWNPTHPVYVDGDSDKGLFEVIGAYEYKNPVGLLRNRTENDRSSSYFTHFSGQFMPTNAITFKTQIGYDIERGMDGYYRTSEHYDEIYQDTYGTASRSADRDVTKTIETTLDWNKDIGEHRLDFIVGYSYQNFVADRFNARNTNFISDDFSYHNLGAGTYLEDGRASMGSQKQESSLVAFFTRGIYNWNHKYFLSFSIRREGSTKFGKNNKWGVFPAISAGWTLTNESFAEGIEWLNYLKLRAGFGKTGNASISPYIPLIRLEPSGYFYYDGTYRQTYEPVSNANPNLKWETKYEYDVGIDWEVLNGRVGGTIDLYTRRTEDLLHNYDVPVPPNLYGTTFANVGTLSNKGIEFSFNAIPVKQENLQWDLNFNFSYQTQKLVSLSNENYKLEWHDAGWLGAPGVQTWTHRYGEGMEIGNFHGWIFEGFTEEGDWIFKDLNGDENIDMDDRTIIGNGLPDYYVSLNTTLTYKNWLLSVMARGQFGHEILNAKKLYYEDMKMLPKNILADYNKDLWAEQQYSDYYLEPGDWVKIDNITLGYTFPFKNTEMINNLQVYFSGRNFFCITKSEVNDPEVSIGGLSPGVSGRYDYPSVRTWTLGFQATF